MGGFGWHNPWPLQFGGGRTLVEKHYDFLRKAPGIGGVAIDEEESIDALWRQARARAMAALEAFSDRALVEAFPNRATSLLPYYEWLLGIPVPQGANDEERRAEATRRYTFEVPASMPALSDELTAIDPRLSILDIPWDQVETTYEGRAFEDLDGLEPYGGGRRSTITPNYSTSFDVVVLFDLSATGGVPTADDARIIDLVKDYLADVLPSWVEFRVISSVGFILDLSPMDITGFGT